MGDIIHLPTPTKRNASPFSLYLRGKRREERTDLAIYGLFGACAVAVILFGAVKAMPGHETSEARTNRIDRIEKLKDPKADWAHSLGKTNIAGARS